MKYFIYLNEIIMILTLLFLTTLLMPISANKDEVIKDTVNSDVSKKEKYITSVLDWINDNILGSIESLIPDQREGKSNTVEGICNYCFYL